MSACWPLRKTIWPPSPGPPGGAARARRAADTKTLTSTPAGRRLLALRALANQPLRRLTRLPGDDPATAWIDDDPAAVRALAALETRRWGVRMRQEVPALDQPAG